MVVNLSYGVVNFIYSMWPYCKRGEGKMSRLEAESRVTVDTIKRLNFPERLKIYSALAHGTRVGILKTIAKKNPRSFTELKTIHNLNPNTLSYHLKALEYAGLIRSEYEKKPENRKYSRYWITGLGRELLNYPDYTKLL